MTSRFLSGSAATLLLSAVVFAQLPPSAAEPQAQLALTPIPPILRLHLPILGQKRGVLVESVSPGSAAENAGLRSGDVLLEAGGRSVIAGASLTQTDSSFPLVVIRRGRMQVLRPGMPEKRFDRAMIDSLDAPALMFDAPAVGFENQGFTVTSSASSSSFGDRAVSISRAGDQISLEMSLPQVAEGPIRLRGTAAEIEQQLQASQLAESAKREVRAALRQAR